MYSELFVIGTFNWSFYFDEFPLSFKKIENKLDAMIEHLGVDFQLYKDTPKEVYVALEKGQRIKVIKLDRQLSGVGLKEA